MHKSPGKASYTVDNALYTTHSTNTSPRLERHSRCMISDTGSRHIKTWMAFIGLAVGFVALLGFARPTAFAALTPISQSYSSTDKVAVGSIVSLNDNTSDQVSAATSSKLNGILGIVINDGSSLLSLTNDQAGQVQVATSGVIQVSVSNINGEIAQGDQITASPISGVGMKATSSVKVVGIAQEELSQNGGSTQSYADKSGQKKSVLLGQIPVLVNVSYFYKQPDKTIVPSAIQNVANALAGKAVNPLPVLVSMGIFIVTLVVVVSIIYSIIHSSIISVGRNPMSQSAIYRNIVQLSALVIGILVVAVVSIYMVLTKL